MGVLGAEGGTYGEAEGSPNLGVEASYQKSSGPTVVDPGLAPTPGV